MLQVMNFLEDQTISIWSLGFVTLFILVSLLNPASFPFYGKKLILTDTVPPVRSKKYFKSINAQRFKIVSKLVLIFFFSWIIIGCFHGFFRQFNDFFDYFWPVFFCGVLILTPLSILFYRRREKWGEYPAS
jgi:hypothetical protein